MTTDNNGTTTWTDQTQATNPQHYPISAIMVDPTDSMGKTAYVALMGFGTPHIWRTASAGVAWTAFENATSSLPNSPVNALALDTDGTLYVGTDVGVFRPQTMNVLQPNWMEVCPNSAGVCDSTGLLPNVSVTALRIFNDGATKWLRAATYGRGIWQYPLAVAPDFELAVPNPKQTTFVSQAASFTGTLTALDTYNSAVELTCVPGMCSPTMITPTNTGAQFTIQASGAVGDHPFNLQAIGQDPSSITRIEALTLHVLDFTLGQPAPSTITMMPEQTSDPVTLQLSFAGSFPSNSTVQFACTAPSGVTCSFSPSTVNVSGSGATVAMTMAADGNTTAGNSSVDIAATASAGAAETLHQSIALGVITAGYALTLHTTTLTLPARQPATITATATAADGYSSAVNLSCSATLVAGTGPAPQCSVTPATLTASSSGTPFQVKLAAGTAGTYSLNIQGTGTDTNATRQNAQLAVTLYDFSATASPDTQTVSGGQPATFTLNLTPTGLQTFPQPISFSCPQLPSGASCSFSPSQLNAGDGAKTIALTISTMASMASLRPPNRTHSRTAFFAMFLPLTTMILLCSGLGKCSRRRRALCLALASVALFVVVETSCGGGLTGGTQGALTPPTQAGSSNTYVIGINVTEGWGTQALQPAQPVQVILVVD